MAKRDLKGWPSACIPGTNQKTTRNTRPCYLVFTSMLSYVLCGAEGWVDIESFGNTKEAWLKTFLDLPSAHSLTRYFWPCVCAHRAQAV